MPQRDINGAPMTAAAQTPEEREIFRLQCIHHKVCKYLCVLVCPYRDTSAASESAVLEELKKLFKLCKWESWCKKYHQECKRPCDFFERISSERIMAELRQEKEHP